MRTKTLLWVSLIMLLSMVGCKSKMQETSSAPTADAASKAMEQTQAPTDSQQQASPESSASEQASEQTTQAAIGQNVEQITSQPEASAPLEGESTTSPEAQPETATQPNSSEEPASK